MEGWGWGKGSGFANDGVKTVKMVKRWSSREKTGRIWSDRPAIGREVEGRGQWLMVYGAWSGEVME